MFQSFQFFFKNYATALYLSDQILFITRVLSEFWFFKNPDNFEDGHSLGRFCISKSFIVQTSTKIHSPSYFMKVVLRPAKSLYRPRTQCITLL